MEGQHPGARDYVSGPSHPMGDHRLSSSLLGPRRWLSANQPRPSKAHTTPRIGEWVRLGVRLSLVGQAHSRSVSSPLVRMTSWRAQWWPPATSHAASPRLRGRGQAGGDLSSLRCGVVQSPCISTGRSRPLRTLLPGEGRSAVVIRVERRESSGCRLVSPCPMVPTEPMARCVCG